MCSRKNQINAISQMYIQHELSDNRKPVKAGKPPVIGGPQNWFLVLK